MRGGPPADCGETPPESADIGLAWPSATAGRGADCAGATGFEGGELAGAWTGVGTPMSVWAAFDANGPFVPGSVRGTPSRRALASSTERSI